MHRLPCILTIAGSDSGGGAGIQADIKAISMLGGYAASVITALTAQNTKAVTGIHAPAAEFVAEQLRAVLDDIEVDAAKTGMLFSEPIIRAIAPILSQKKFPLVVDPVCVATSGAKLLEDDAVDAMVRLIFPLADLLTPNIPEAELFTGVKINGREDVFKAARLLLDKGPKAVLVKGGHSDSWAITDWYVEQGKEPVPFMQQRVDTKSTHGTGCTLSAAIATGLGQGMDAGAAVKRAQEYLNLGLRAGYQLGEGGGPPNHLAPLIKANARSGVLREVDRIGRWLSAEPGMHQLFPQSKSNLAISLPYADGLSEVAGFTGGVVCSRRGDVLVAGYPEFGASAKTAATLLAVRRLNSAIGAAVTLKLNEAMKQALEQTEIEIVWMDRDRAPEYIGGEGGQFEEWGAFESLKSHSSPEKVRAVGDPGGFGAERAVHVVATDGASLQAILMRLLDCCRENNG